MLKRSELCRGDDYREKLYREVIQVTLAATRARVGGFAQELLLAATCFEIEDATGDLWAGLGEWIEQLIPE